MNVRKCSFIEVVGVQRTQSGQPSDHTLNVAGNITKINSFDRAASAIIPPTKYSDNMNAYNSALFLDPNLSRLPSLNSFADGLDLFRSDSFMMSPTVNSDGAEQHSTDSLGAVKAVANSGSEETGQTNRPDGIAMQSGRKRTIDEIPTSADENSADSNKARTVQLPGKMFMPIDISVTLYRIAVLLYSTCFT
jgi:hypothetical protein